MKNKVLLYPYNINSIAFVEYCNRCSTKYEIIKLVSPKGWGLEGKDGGDAYNFDKLGIKVGENIYDSINDIDTLLIYNTGNKMIYNEMIEYIDYTLAKKKKVICNYKLNDEHAQKYQSNSLFSYNQINHADMETNIFEMVEDIHIPVVYVGDIIPNLSNGYTAWNIVDELSKKGIQTLLVTKDNAAKIVGHAVIPEVIFNNQLDSVDKVYTINHFIKNLEKKRIDIIVIDLPYPIMQYNNIITNDFGIMTYLFGKAVPPDYMVLNVNYDTVDYEYYQTIGSDIEGVLGKNISAFCMYNVMIDSYALEDRKKLETLYVRYDDVEKIVSRQNSLYNLYSANNHDTYIKIVQDMIQYFES